MKRIVVNALSARLGGGQTYILNVLRHIDPENDYLFLVGPYNKDKFEAAAPHGRNLRFIDCGARQANPLYRLLWERFVLSRRLKEWKADVYYAAGGGTFTVVPKGCVSALAVRNMLPFDDRERRRFPFFSPARLNLRLLRSIALFALRRCDKVVFISRYSQDAVTKNYPQAAHKGKVIYHGLDERFFQPAEKEFDFSRFGLKKGEFYLYVSILNYYKAQAELVGEWEKLVEAGFPFPLVLTGFTPRGYSEKVIRLIAEKRLESNVIITGPVSYEELPAYYAGARALVFASSCECCPNILLEMMSMGKPVFCSDIPPMPEFGGEAPYYFNPYKKGELASLVSETEKDEAAMTARGRKNRDQAFQFNWQKTIDETIRFLTNDD